MPIPRVALAMNAVPAPVMRVVSLAPAILRATAVPAATSTAVIMMMANQRGPIRRAAVLRHVPPNRTWDCRSLLRS